MKVVVMGAAGKTGSLVVERALVAGHTVSCLIRSQFDGIDRES
jgi:putative NADH-flavin reductase